MKGHTKILLSIAITGMLFMSLPGMLFLAGADDDTGGTDPDISVEGNPGGGFDWNEVHGFVMSEDGTKVDEEFNITLCQEVKWRNDGEDGPNWYPSGHIFGELTNIEWDETPEPSILIPREELEENKGEDDDTVNTTVYILGKYMRDNPHGDDEARKAYKKIQVQRPNNAPNAVAMVTIDDEYGNGMWDNWTTVETNNGEEIVYYIDSDGASVKIYLNASESWDKDGDNITEYIWDYDGDGEFGKVSNERKVNTTYWLGEGDHNLGLIVGDGNKVNEPPLDIKIVVRQPIRYADLMIQDLEVVNTNGQEEIYKGDRAIVRAQVKNNGDNKSTEQFDVYFEYWNRDQYEAPNWLELGSLTWTDDIEVNQLKLIETPWDTGFGDYDPGTYSFRATVDYLEQVKELREQNNMFPAEGDDRDAENVSLLANPDEGDPNINIVDVAVSKDTARVNEVVWVNITLENTGTGNARYVDIHYYIDNVNQYYKTIDLLEKDTEWTEPFVFSGDSNNTFKVKLEVKDDGITVETSDVYSIKVWGNINDPVDIEDPVIDDGDDGGNEMLPIIMVVVVVAAGLGGAGFFFMRKKDEDVW